jgi:CRISPR-associated protein Cas1
MWTRSEWADCADTVEGRRVHIRADRPGPPLPSSEIVAAVEPVLTTRAITLSSATFGVIVKSDIAEAEDGLVTPIDYKRGKRPHRALGAFEPERIQVCLQALLLEEHGYCVAEGAIWYAECRERVRTALDGPLHGQRCISCVCWFSKVISRRRSPIARNARAVTWWRSACSTKSVL